VTSGSLEALHQTKKLAAGSMACPSWCDRRHDPTGDDRGISHERVVIGPLAHRCVEAYLRATETVDDPGILGPVSLAVFSTEPQASGRGWFLEVAVDGPLADLQDAVARAMTLMSSMRRMSPPAESADTPGPELADDAERTLVSAANG
jgi:hypothetical protein